MPILINGEAILTDCTVERLRAEIRVRFGFRKTTVADADRLMARLRDHVAGEVGGDIEPMIARLETRCKELSIEPLTPDRIEHITRSALHAHEARWRCLLSVIGVSVIAQTESLHSQKLSRPDVGMTDAYPNLQQILTNPIDWDCVLQQYDQMVKYTTALRFRTAETEAILALYAKEYPASDVQSIC